MPTPRNALVWIDQHEARIFHIDQTSFTREADSGGVDKETLKAPHHHLHRRHPDGATEKAAHPVDQNHFFQDVASKLEGADSIVIVGPAAAKLHFLRYLHTHAAPIEAHVRSVETVDHPSDPQLIAYAKQYFAPPASRHK